MKRKSIDEKNEKRNLIIENDVAYISKYLNKRGKEYQCERELGTAENYKRAVLRKLVKSLEK